MIAYLISYSIFNYDALEVSPAAQGASLTEGKKAKRKDGKNKDERGSPKQGSDSDNELDAPDTNVSLPFLNYLESSKFDLPIIRIASWVLTSYEWLCFKLSYIILIRRGMVVYHTRLQIIQLF